MFDPLSILAIFGPVAVEAGKAAISRWIAPKEFKPATIEQFVTMRKLELEWFNAINSAGGANASYPWVEAIVRLMRPSVAAVVILTWATLRLSSEMTASSETLAAVDNFAAAIGFYLFGDRTLFYTNKPKSK